MQNLPYHYLRGYMKDGPSGRVSGLGGDLLRDGHADNARMGRASPIESEPGTSAEDVREECRPGETSRMPRMLAVWLLQLSVSKLEPVSLVRLLAHSMTSTTLLLLGAAAEDPVAAGLECWGLMPLTG